LGAFLIAIYVLLGWGGLDVSMEKLQGWGRDLGPLGALLFVPLGALLNTFFLPFPLIAGAAGAIFGVAEGTASAIAIAPLAAVIQMLMARHVIRDTTGRLLGRHSERINRVLERRGFTAVLYTHLVPGLPYAPLNFAAGLTRLRVRDMGAGTALAKAPRAFAYAALGGSLSNLDAPEAQVAIVLLVLLTIGGGIALRWQIAAERRDRDATRQREVAPGRE